MVKFPRKRTIVIIFSLFIIAVASLVLKLGHFFINPAEREAEEQVIILEEGLSLKEIAENLERAEIITSKTLFMLLTRVLGYSRKIKAGEYKLGPHMAPGRILDVLTKGLIITHTVTVPEGFTRPQIAELLAGKGLVNYQDFLSFTDDPAMLKRYGLDCPSLEGYLYPDTYQFGRGLSSKSIIDVMVRRFLEVMGSYRGSVAESGMTMEEVVILASIVEKETGRGDERPIIASVFLNRLKKRMRLESDPTVIYGIKDFNGNLTRKDLSRPNPYNTYTIRGLPPGPIASPGEDAIKAVLNPAKTDYLYFVSKNDGSHYFSKTLSEHNRAVKIYQKQRRKRRGKTS